MFAGERREQVVEAIVVLGHFLVFQREGQHGFIAKAKLGRSRNLALRRLFDGDEIRRGSFGTASIASFQIRHQKDRNPGERGRHRGRKRGDGLPQVFL